MISADIQTVMPEIILAVYAMLALLVAVYTTKDAMAPLLTWVTSGLFVLLAFVFFARFLLLAVFLAKPSSQPSKPNSKRAVG